MTEPGEFESVFPALLNRPVPAGTLVGDVYLAAFCMAAHCRFLATLDRGFRRFGGLEVEILYR